MDELSQQLERINAGKTDTTYALAGIPPTQNLVCITHKPRGRQEQKTVLYGVTPESFAVFFGLTAPEKTMTVDPTVSGEPVRVAEDPAPVFPVVNPILMPRPPFKQGYPKGGKSK